MTKKDHARRRGFVFVLCGALLFLTCASWVTLASLSPEEQDRIQTRSFGSPDSTLFSAVLDVLIDKGYAIQLSDRSSGLIQTEPRQIPLYGAAMSLGGADQLGSDNPLRDIGTARRTILARVKGGTVKLSMTLETHADPGWKVFQSDTSLANRPYRDAFDLIEAKLKH
jgi:hypothetical protein